MRRVLAWGLVSTFTLTLVAMIFCAFGFSVRLYSQSGAYTGVVGGSVWIGVHEKPIPEWPFVFVSWRSSWAQIAEAWATVGGWPRRLGSGWGTGSGSIGISVPLWMPLLAFGIPMIWLWRRNRRRIEPGCCANCGYNLTGNVSGRCPECGAVTESERPAVTVSERAC
ncbi:MAG: hypothetical protein AMXMBFR47_29160 [Planctomycetota bacterium]